MHKRLLVRKGGIVIPQFATDQHELADEELQRAIQLSLEEVGAANVNGRYSRPGYTLSQPEPSSCSKWQTSERPPC